MSNRNQPQMPAHLAERLKEEQGKHLTPEQSQAEHDAASARHDALLHHRSAQGHDEVAHAHAVAAGHVSDPSHGASRHLHAPDEQLAKAVEEKRLSVEQQAKELEDLNERLMRATEAERAMKAQLGETVATGGRA
ncbi:hypothetical protein JCM1840_005532 [Sporobolomyces johnsonii]